MSGPAGTGRIHSASRIVAASPDVVYRAFVNPESLAKWLPPGGMTGKIHA